MTGPTLALIVAVLAAAVVGVVIGIAWGKRLHARRDRKGGSLWVVLGGVGAVVLLGLDDHLALPLATFAIFSGGTAAWTIRRRLKAEGAV